MEIVRYDKSYKEVWNNLLNNSQTDSFLFHRDYMDYHSDRFDDSSFIFFKKGKPVAILPGNIKGDTFYSYQGLTFGGLIWTINAGCFDFDSMFDLLENKLSEIDVKNIVYKKIPHIYNKYPSQEDVFAMNKRGYQNILCQLSSVIYMNNKIGFNESRKSGLRKAKNNHLTFSETEDFTQFWNLLEEMLHLKYGSKPVHTISEMSYLKSKFPENIKLYCAYHEQTLLGGTVVFQNKNNVKTQYIISSDEGKQYGCLDFIFDNLINNVYDKYSYFDFGTSHLENGRDINESLLFQKEGFGARGITYDVYKKVL